MSNYGEGKYWDKQTDNVSYDGARENTMQAMEALGKWFYEKTKHKLVITSVTDGSHAAGEYSHANGWKFDCNDWAGPEGLGGQFFGYFNDDPMTPLAQEFIKYGCEKLGVGVNLEGDHFDIAVNGDKWSDEDGTGTGNFGGFNMSNNKKLGTFAAKGVNANNSNTTGTVTSGNTIYLKPKNKTFVEPQYPDLLTLPGNIPANLIEAATSGSNGNKVTNSYKTMSAAELQDLTGLAVAGFTTDKAMQERQKTYNVNKNINDVKQVSGGKPLNNNDRYPVDLKIEELQIHKPQVKLNSITLPSGITQNARELASGILQVADHAEKRICKIENVLGTVMRYVFGMAGRMYVNCQYYGGQDPRSRYKCIRCMRDDRINDGAIVQIDQCLSCTRYEPVYGQVYDILNAQGTNLAIILDDAQSGYYNLHDYAKNTRTDKHPRDFEDATFNITKNTERDPNDKDFNDKEWDQGVRMKWKLTPMENQKPLINWRQDINKPDSSPRKLPSYQLSTSNISQSKGTASGDHNSGLSNTKQQTGNNNKILKPTDSTNSMNLHWESLSNNTHEAIMRWFGNAKEFAFGTAGAAAAVVQNVENQEIADYINKICAENNIDPYLMTSIFAVESGGILRAPGGGIGGTNSSVKDTTTAIEDISAAVNTLKRYMNSSDGDNYIFAVQYYGMRQSGTLTDKLRNANHSGQMYDKNFLDAIQVDFAGSSSVEDRVMEYWPKVVCVYRELVQHAHEG